MQINGAINYLFYAHTNLSLSHFWHLILCGPFGEKIIVRIRFLEPYAPIKELLAIVSDNDLEKLTRKQFKKFTAFIL